MITHADNCKRAGATRPFFVGRGEAYRDVCRAGEVCQRLEKVPTHKGKISCGGWISTNDIQVMRLTTSIGGRCVAEVTVRMAENIDPLAA